jgi:hypothetical protein
MDTHTLIKLQKFYNTLQNNLSIIDTDIQRFLDVNCDTLFKNKTNMDGILREKCKLVNCVRYGSQLIMFNAIALLVRQEFKHAMDHNINYRATSKALAIYMSNSEQFDDIKNSPFRIYVLLTCIGCNNHNSLVMLILEAEYSIIQRCNQLEQYSILLETKKKGNVEIKFNTCFGISRTEYEQLCDDFRIMLNENKANIRQCIQANIADLINVKNLHHLREIVDGLKKKISQTESYMSQFIKHLYMYVLMDSIYDSKNFPLFTHMVCATCNKTASKLCPCFKVRYCDSDCQKIHWKIHKNCHVKN